MVETVAKEGHGRRRGSAEGQRLVHTAARTHPEARCAPRPPSLQEAEDAGRRPPREESGKGSRAEAGGGGLLALGGHVPLGCDGPEEDPIREPPAEGEEVAPGVFPAPQGVPGMLGS